MSVTVYIVDSTPDADDFGVGDNFVINKPDNVKDWPGWASYMDVLDGKRGSVVEIGFAGVRCVVDDVEFHEGTYGFGMGYCDLIKKWLSKDDQELDEIDFNIKELF